MGFNFSHTETAGCVPAVGCNVADDFLKRSELAGQNL